MAIGYEETKGMLWTPKTIRTILFGQHKSNFVFKMQFNQVVSCASFLRRFLINQDARSISTLFQEKSHLPVKQTLSGSLSAIFRSKLEKRVLFHQRMTE